MDNYKLLEYACRHNWLSLFKKVYKKADYTMQDLLPYCLRYNSYICAEYILNNYKIDWNKWSDWIYWPKNHNNKELALLLIKYGCNIDKEIKYCKNYSYKEELKFCLEIKKEIANAYN